MSHISLKVNGQVHAVDVDPKCLVAVCPSRQPGAQQSQIRLRAWAMRRMHRARGQSFGAFVPAAGFAGGRQGNRHARWALGKP